MSDDDLIRRGDAVLAVTAADKECLGANGAREFIRALPAVQDTVGAELTEARALAASQPADPVTNDPECTDCGGTGITYQTERRCACQPALADSQPVELALRVQLAEVQADLTFMTEDRNKWQDSATDRYFRIEEANARAERAEQRVAALEAAPVRGVVMAEKLKPCPFCGGDDLYFPHGTDPAVIECSGCGARSGVPDDQTEVEATAKWNARVAPSLRITGPNSDGEYWLHIKAGGRSGGVNLGGEHGPICKRLFDAASETGAKE